MPDKIISNENKTPAIRLVHETINNMYRFAGILLMFIGTFLILMLGSLVLIWAEIIQAPKLFAGIRLKFNNTTPELVPTES